MLYGSIRRNLYAHLSIHKMRWTLVFDYLFTPISTPKWHETIWFCMKFYKLAISKNLVTMRFYGLLLRYIDLWKKANLQQYLASYGKTTFRVITDFYYSDFPGRKQPKKRNLLPDAEKFTLYSKLFCSYRPQAAPCRRKELLVTAQMRPSGLPFAIYWKRRDAKPSLPFYLLLSPPEKQGWPVRKQGRLIASALSWSSQSVF